MKRLIFLIALLFVVCQVPIASAETRCYNPGTRCCIGGGSTGTYCCDSQGRSACLPGCEGSIACEDNGGDGDDGSGVYCVWYPSIGIICIPVF